MFPRRHRLKLAFALVALLALGLYLSRPIREAFALRAIEGAVARGSVHAHIPEGTVPAEERLVHRIGLRLFSDEKWSSWYYHWGRHIFDGPIERVHIEGGTLRGDIGAALARLPHLRIVTVEPDTARPGSVSMDEAGLKQLCTALRAVPQLEKLDMWGAAVTDHAITPLAGHAKLAQLSLDYTLQTHVTSKSIPTFTSLSALQRLELGGLREKGGIDVIRAALPRVEVEERDDYADVRDR